MRFREYPARLLILCFVLGALTARAQFKEPTKDELRMTAEPRAPGAPFIYLDYEDVRDQETTTDVIYRRIKVLTEKGKEAATVTLEYLPKEEKMPLVDARTIHADGTVVPMTEKPASLVDLKTKEVQLNKLVFTLPSVEVGSILEYRIREVWKDSVSDPTWYLQQEQFTRHEHFQFHAVGLTSESDRTVLPPDIKLQQKGQTYFIDTSNISPLPDEEWTPPLNTIREQVSFFKLVFFSDQEFWSKNCQIWATLMRDVTQPTNLLKVAAASLVAPGDSATVKAQKIYAAVQAMDNTDFSRQISETERKKRKISEVNEVQDLWTIKRGSGDGLTLLFVALCRAAGLDVEPIGVTNRALAVFNPTLPSFDQFDDLVAVARLDGKEIYLDPGQKMCPFGLLYWGHMLTRGIRYKDKTAEVADMPLPDFKQTGIARVADLSVDETGNIQGVMRLVFSGQEALAWRQVALRNDEGEMKRKFTESIQQSLPQGVQAEFDHFLGLNDYESNLIVYFKVSGTLGTVTGKRVMVPALFFDVNAKHPFVSSEKRFLPIDLHYPYLVRELVNYTMPAGYSLPGPPQDARISWPERALATTKTTVNGNVVSVHRDMVMGAAILSPTDYSELHDYSAKLAAADQQLIVFERVHQ